MGFGSSGTGYKKLPGWGLAILNFTLLTFMSVIRLRVPAQAAKPGPPLSPVLGQHQIKVAEFVTQFNTGSAGWTPGTPLGVRILKAGPSWSLRVLTPGVVISLGGLQAQGLTRQDLWAYLTHFSPRVTPAEGRTLFGTLRSLGWEIL